MKKKNSIFTKINLLGFEISKKLNEVIENQGKKLKLDIYDNEEDEIINGLFFRIFRFYRAYIIDPNLMDVDFSEIIYRTTLESYIYLKFLTDTNKKELYIEFKKYGIGQEKLFKLQLIELIEKKEIKETTELLEYVNSQTDDEIWDEIVSVKLKNFDNIRDIAEKSGLKSQYNLAYQPYSISIHGHWTALKRFYLRRCRNSMHRLHFVGTTEFPPISFRFISSFMELFYDSYKIWTRIYDLEDKIDPLLDQYAKGIREILSKTDDIKKDVTLKNREESPES